MIELAAMFLLFVVVLTVLARAGAVCMGRKAGRTTRRRFEEAQYLIETARAPANWLDRTAGLAEGPRLAELLDRLDRLIEFFRTAPVVADRATRQLLLDKLRGIRGRWQRGGPAQLPVQRS